MRERITYVQKLGDSLEPSEITIDGGNISGPEVHAVREDRLTIALDELPSELRALLKDALELHIRWVSTTPYEAISPLLARLPPGFHVFFTPRREEAVLYANAQIQAVGTTHSHCHAAHRSAQHSPRYLETSRVPRQQ